MYIHVAVATLAIIFGTAVTVSAQNPPGGFAPVPARGVISTLEQAILPLTSSSATIKTYQGDGPRMRQTINEPEWQGQLAREYFGWNVNLVRVEGDSGALGSRVYISWNWQNHWHQIKNDGMILSNNGRHIKLRKGTQTILEFNDARPDRWQTTWPVSGCNSGPQEVWLRELNLADKWFPITNHQFELTDNIQITALPELFYSC